MSDNLLERLRNGWDEYDVPMRATDAMSEAAARIEALTAQLESTLRDRKVILEERDRTFALMLRRAEKAEAERERLALAICGGEDAPGYANAQTVEALEHVAKQNQQSHGATINSLLAAEAERDRLRAVLSDIKTASVCSVSRHVAASALGEAAA